MVAKKLTSAALLLFENSKNGKKDVVVINKSPRKIIDNNKISW